MTIFLHGKVFFMSLFGMNHQKRSRKQFGKISKAINNVKSINEDIAISIDKDYSRIYKLKDRINDKRSVKDVNSILVSQLDKLL